MATKNCLEIEHSGVHSTDNISKYISLDLIILPNYLPKDSTFKALLASYYSDKSPDYLLQIPFC